MKKAKRFLTVLLAGIMISFCVFFISCNLENKNSKKNTIKVVAYITKIEIPEDCEIVYKYTRNNVGWGPGRNTQYTVFKFEVEPTEFLNDNGFSSERDIKNENDFYNGDFGFNTYISEYPDEFIPDLENEYLWLTVERVYFFYLKEILTLYVYIPA